MRKIALAFVAGAAAGWLAAVVAQTPAPGPAPPSAEAPAPARPGPAPPEVPRSPRVHADPQPSSSAPAPAEAKGKKTKPPNPPAPPAAKPLTDDEIRALMSHTDPGWRGRGLTLAAGRGLVSVAQLLDRARGDPDGSVRADALGLAVGKASDDDGTLALASSEVLAWARDTDPEKRRLGLEFLDETGAYGAGLGRELLDQGGLPTEVYQAAVHTLVAARRFDRLAPVELDDQSYECLVGELSGALDADASLAPQVAGVLRSAGLPPPSENSSWNYCALAVKAGAPDLVRDMARSSSASTTSRTQAFQLLFDDPGEAPGAVALAGEILADPASSAARRREIVNAIGSNLMQQGEPGLAVLRRVADHDANPFVRELAKEYLDAAESAR